MDQQAGVASILRTGLLEIDVSVDYGLKFSRSLVLMAVRDELVLGIFLWGKKRYEPFNEPCFYSSSLCRLFRQDPHRL
jgi:hypothetical protein